MTPPGRRVVFVAANPSVDRLYEVEQLVAGEIHRPRLAVATPGGKGLNAARAAAALGCRVTAIGIVGGRTGDWIIERLAEAGLDARMARTERETRTCVSIVDGATGRLTELYERGEEIERGAWDALEEIAATELATGDVAAVTFSGSLPRGAPVDGYARIARVARQHGVAAIADTYGRALDAVLSEGPTVVKLNASEAAAASGAAVEGPAGAVEAADLLHSRGAGSVVVTLGVAGAVLVTATSRLLLVPPDVRGAYPVGSGDAVLGGLAAGLARGASLLEAARCGIGAGVAQALVPGTGELDRETAERLATEVMLQPA